jgi:hypothetical protein
VPVDARVGTVQQQVGQVGAIKSEVGSGSMKVRQPRPPMRLCMAFSAQRDQVLFRVATRLAPEVLMMHLQMLHAAAHLTSPVVALQYLPISSRYLVASSLSRGVLARISFMRPSG